jgi:hypothetical protein
MSTVSLLFYLHLFLFSAMQGGFGIIAFALAYFKKRNGA